MNTKPAALALGRTTFLGLEIEVSPGVLVPREETELLARAAIERIAALGGSPSVVDMCTGAGNLACAIASAVPAARVFASDLTDDCVALASRNVARLGLSDRVTVAQGDLFAGLAPFGLENAVDVVVCNPPYISRGRLESQSAHLLAHEPREAFDGGPYGLSIHQRVARDALAFLKPGGPLLFEIGLGQDRQVKVLIQRAKAYGDVVFLNDAQGNPRVAVATRLG